MSEAQGSVAPVVAPAPVADAKPVAAPVEAKPPEQVKAEVVEKPAEPKPADKPPEDIKAKQFAAIAKAERALREREAALANRQREIDERIKAYEERDRLAKTDPFEYLAKSGLSYKQLTDLALKGGVLEQSPHDQKIAALEQKIAAWEKAEAERVEAMTRREREHAEAVEKRFRDGMAELVASDSKYPACAAVGDEAIEVAWQVVTAHFAETGKALTRDEALARVEAHYRSVIESGAKALGLVTPPKEPAGTAEAKPKDSTPKTLTNELAQQATPAPRPEPDRAEGLRAAAERMFAAKKQAQLTTN